MRYLVAELIQKKRDGQALSSDELAFLVKGFSDGGIPDYQVAAWLMATYFQGMTGEETLTLTREMKDSGQTLKWRELDPAFKDFKFADKHSTGGVGDKVSLILAPIAASLGLKVPMMSGRGLGFTGGTVDKLLTIPGFQMDLPPEKLRKAIADVGVCMMSQSETLCPADRKLYALRDVTATVESLPLITASIVSKKWAAGVENIVYDLKCGSAAFMLDREHARALAKSLVEISKLAGMKAVALVTRMEEPLGAFVGNALEVRESVYILRNQFPDDHHECLAAPLTALSCRLVAEMAVLAGAYPDVDLAYAAALKSIQNGSAWKTFQGLLKAQGAVDDWEQKLPSTEIRMPYRSKKAGYVSAIRSRHLGFAGIKIGAGRETSNDLIAPATGFELCVGVGQKVEHDQILCLVHLDNQLQYDLVEGDLDLAFVVGDQAVDPPGELTLEKIT